MSKRLEELQAKREKDLLSPEECKELSLLESGDCGGVKDGFKYRPIKQSGGFADERLAD